MPLPFPGTGLPGVFLLRRPEDIETVIAAARTARRAVVIGAGFLGMEAAASLQERGLEGPVTAPAGASFEHQLGAEIGQFFRRLHERKGLAFRFDLEVVMLERNGWVRCVVLQDGSVLSVDLIVAGLGVKPAGPLQQVPLREDGGVTVDARMRVGENLYAACDLAAFCLRGNGDFIRVEHWRVAQQHGRVAALNMLALEKKYDAVPVFWTIQYRQRLDYLGHAAKGARS